MQNKYIITYEIDRKYTISLGRVRLKIRINCIFSVIINSRNFFLLF